MTNPTRLRPRESTGASLTRHTIRTSIPMVTMIDLRGSTPTRLRSIIFDVLARVTTKTGPWKQPRYVSNDGSKNYVRPIRTLTKRISLTCYIETRVQVRRSNKKSTHTSKTRYTNCVRRSNMPILQQNRKNATCYERVAQTGLYRAEFSSETVRVEYLRLKK